MSQPNCLTRSFLVSLLTLAAVSFATGCATLIENPAELRFHNHGGDSDLAKSQSSAETTSETTSSRTTMGDVRSKAEGWFFGPGLGRALTNVGTSILFPPYAIYLIGNATLSLSGLQPLYMTDLLPDKPREGVLEVYDAFTSVPGRLTSTVAGREYPD